MRPKLCLTGPGNCGLTSMHLKSPCRNCQPRAPQHHPAPIMPALANVRRPPLSSGSRSSQEALPGWFYLIRRANAPQPTTPAPLPLHETLRRAREPCPCSLRRERREAPESACTGDDTALHSCGTSIATRAGSLPFPSQGCKRGSVRKEWNASRSPPHPALSLPPLRRRFFRVGAITRRTGSLDCPLVR